MLIEVNLGPYGQDDGGVCHLTRAWTRAMREPVEDLIRDLIVTLGTVASDFGDRADRLIAADGGSIVVPMVDLAKLAERLLASRRARRKYFPNGLFNEPAWEMLLTLFLEFDHGGTMNVKALVACSGSPATTSQRWIEQLFRFHLIDRVVDSADRRRVEISLSQEGFDAMRRYLGTVDAA